MMKLILLLKNGLLEKTFHRYVLVGIFNTVVGLGIVWTLFYGLSINYHTSYLIGTCIGVLNSFVLNRCFTFKSKMPWATGLFKFLLSSAVSYLISSLCLTLSVEQLNLPHSVAFILAMASYTLVNYFLNRVFVFRTSKKRL